MLPGSLAGLTGEGLSLLKPLRLEEAAISSNTQTPMQATRKMKNQANMTQAKEESKCPVTNPKEMEL